jgi:uncharacterized protein (TIGR02266 family)
MADFLERYAHNISLSGMFLASEEIVPVGTVLYFQFQFEEDPPLSGEGIVTWVRDKGAPGKPRGMGIRFLNISPSMEEWLKRIVKVQKEEIVL